MINKEIALLLDTLRHKKDFFHRILLLTTDQQQLLKKTEQQKLDMDRFEAIINEKEGIVNKINTYDDGFQAIYDKIKESLEATKEDYKDDIKEMQTLIKELTELTIKIKNMEEKNKLMLDNYFSKERKQIGTFRKSQTIVSAYDKVMKKNINYESYFVDKKK